MGKLELSCHLVENCHFDSEDQRFIDRGFPSHTQYCRLQDLHQSPTIKPSVK